MFLEDTSHNELVEIIKEFKNDKSSDIPIVVVKHCSIVIAPTLCKLYNRYMQIGVFPDSLKFGKITPIHKKGRKDHFKNYRPISTLPIFGKIFEKVLYKRIYDFVSSRNIISETQFGFRANHSTSHAIHHSVDFIKQAHAKNKHVLSVFIDLSKAFDTIDHEILLHKLSNYGIRGTPHCLLRSYLSNRYQQVKVDGHLSNSLLVKFGVPQGSVLGPLLFLLYINDLQQITLNKHNIKFVLYADDTNIFVACSSLAEATTVTQNILHEVNNYMISNLLHINLDKSCFMYFPPTHKSTTIKQCKEVKSKNSKRQNSEEILPIISGITLFIGKTQIPEVTETRFLGVMVDPYLKWNAHIEHLISKEIKNIIRCH